MALPHIIIDTSVLVAGFRSRLGYAFDLISLIGKHKFDIHLSVPLMLEYESVLLREISNLYVNDADIEEFLDFCSTVAVQHEIFFLWRPHLPDPKDDMLMELAFSAKCDYIVTYNKRDFRGSEILGVKVIDPASFLVCVGEQP